MYLFPTNTRILSNSGLKSIGVDANQKDISSNNFIVFQFMLLFNRLIKLILITLKTKTLNRSKALANAWILRRNHKAKNSESTEYQTKSALTQVKNIPAIWIREELRSFLMNIATNTTSICS